MIALRTLAAGLRAVESCSPPLAAQLGMGMMFRTTRMASRAEERMALARGRRTSVLSRGAPLATWTFGDDGPTVLLAHGWNGRAEQLVHLVPPLLARGLRVVLFDAPGHGESPGHVASLPLFADAIDDVIAAVASPFAPIQAVVAHSLGGAALTYAMSRQLHAPSPASERALRDELPVRRLVLVSSPIDVRDFIRGFARAVGFGKTTEVELGRRVERMLSVAMDDLYGPKLAANLHAPTLIVHDEDDREVPVQCARLLAGAWEGAELLITRGLGHVRILRDPAVIERVVSFVDG